MREIREYISFSFFYIPGQIFITFRTLRAESRCRLRYSLNAFQTRRNSINFFPRRMQLYKVRYEVLTSKYFMCNQYSILVNNIFNGNSVRAIKLALFSSLSSSSSSFFLYRNKTNVVLFTAPLFTRPHPRVVRPMSGSPQFER